MQYRICLCCIIMSSKIQGSSYLFMEFTFVKIHLSGQIQRRYTVFFIHRRSCQKPDIIKTEGIRTFKHSALTGLCFVQNSAIRPMVQIGRREQINSSATVRMFNSSGGSSTDHSPFPLCKKHLGISKISSSLFRDFFYQRVFFCLYEMYPILRHCQILRLKNTGFIFRSSCIK